MLTLSTTPIPAHAAHVALRAPRHLDRRDPAEGRRPIGATVGRVRQGTIKLALEREVERGGQAFFLHDRSRRSTRSCESCNSCADLRFLSAHGQMRERELEEKMHAFLRGDATSSSRRRSSSRCLDIPQANTLIVERRISSVVGSCYQIRGRVGRSDRRPRIPLLPGHAELSPEATCTARHARRSHRARRRLRDRDARPRRSAALAICSATSSAGHVARARLRAVRGDAAPRPLRELSGERRSPPRPVRVDARVDAYVPRTTSRRKRSRSTSTGGIALTESEDELHELRRRDRGPGIGPLPEPVENLFAIQEAKLKLARARRRLLSSSAAAVDDGRPVVLGSDELRELRGSVDTAVASHSEPRSVVNTCRTPRERSN